jgi:hypothetical protein
MTGTVYVKTNIIKAPRPIISHGSARVSAVLIGVKRWYWGIERLGCKENKPVTH